MVSFILGERRQRLSHGKLNGRRYDHARREVRFVASKVVAYCRSNRYIQSDSKTQAHSEDVLEWREQLTLNRVLSLRGNYAQNLYSLLV